MAIIPQKQLVFYMLIMRIAVLYRANCVIAKFNDSNEL